MPPDHAAGIGAAALPPVQEAMGNPLQIEIDHFVLRKAHDRCYRPGPGRVFSCFGMRRVQRPISKRHSEFSSPWTIRKSRRSCRRTEEPSSKKECYVFDFAPDRALRQIADYSCRLNVDESNPEKKVEEFISFLPVLAYDGSSMKQIDAGGILDIAMSGTSATLLARRWESALLVNVDNNTLAEIDEQ